MLPDGFGTVNLKELEGHHSWLNVQTFCGPRYLSIYQDSYLGGVYEYSLVPPPPSTPLSLPFKGGGGGGEGEEKKNKLGEIMK